MGPVPELGTELQVEKGQVLKKRNAHTHSDFGSVTHDSLLLPAEPAGKTTPLYSGVQLLACGNEFKDNLHEPQSPYLLK